MASPVNTDQPSIEVANGVSDGKTKSNVSTSSVSSFELIDQA